MRTGVPAAVTVHMDPIHVSLAEHHLQQPQRTHSPQNPLWTTHSAPVLFVRQHRLLVKAQTHKAPVNLAADTAEWGWKSNFFSPPFAPHPRLVGDEAARRCEVEGGLLTRQRWDRPLILCFTLLHVCRKVD